MPVRIAVASLIQETNTFSPQPSTLDDFRAQGLWLGAEAMDRSAGTNTEFAGAVERIGEAGARPVPIMRAWAMSGGVLDRPGFATLRGLLTDGLAAAGPVDALVLCLHGALVADGAAAADAVLVEAARAALAPGVPVIVTHDLHANVTRRIVRAADALIGFHTYPHVDQGETGRRGADLALRAADGGPMPGTALAKRPMLVPAESQALADPPMARLRALADAATGGPILDVSLFPVQPWLDVPELGFAVTVTHTGAPGAAAAAEAVADRIAGAAWDGRAGFSVQPVPVAEAIRRIRPGTGLGPVLLVQSADSPTAGATADSAAVIAALREHGRGLRAYATVVDAPAVAACFAAGPGATVGTVVGATLDPRWSGPTPLSGTVRRLGAEPVILTGDSMTGQAISMGRWATVDTGEGLVVLVTERPAPTFDPAGYRHAGLEPADADTVVVRSATMYRAGFRGIHAGAILLDLPGASTPRLDYLEFRHAPRPLHPLDPTLAEGSR
ncbi:M81 family metallopeptidase [Acrocarpospora catenulata]|uniref:M81 family metallopeptidase n=1 Tax=Acrocarpospora catenulata TaxID=2836182 RepID=UPI001BDB1322|nr:M81 family metallopeptidase [Acrocarpospora catenulata]